MALSPAAKVGLTTLVAFGLMAGGLGWLTSMSFGPKGYDFTVTYKDVAGLMNGANVMLMGVRVGKVTAIEPQDRLVLVHVHVFSPSTHVEKNGRFKIMSQGLIGEKSIEIFPPKEPATPAGGPSDTAGAAPGNPTPMPTATPVPVLLANNDIVRGDDPERMELVMEEMTDTFNEFRKGTDPKKFQALLSKTADNLVETTDTIRRISGQAEGIMSGFNRTPGKVNDMLVSIRGAADATERLFGSASPTDLAATSRNLHQLSAGLLTSYHELFGTQQTAATNSTIRSVRDLAQQLDKLASTLNRTAGDPSVQADVRDTIKNIRTLTQSLSGAAALGQPKSLPGFGVSPRIQGVAANTPDGTGIAANLGVRLNFAGNYFQGGLEQIGQGNYLDLGFGSQEGWRGLGYEFGLIRSKIGVGVDYGLTDGIRLSGELYDPFHPTARIGATYFPVVGGQYGLIGQWARTFDQNLNYIWLGVEWRPNL